MGLCCLSFPLCICKAALPFSLAYALVVREQHGEEGRLSCRGDVATADVARPPAIEGCSNAHANGYLFEAKQNAEPRTIWVLEVFEQQWVCVCKTSTHVAKSLVGHTRDTCHIVEHVVLVWHEGPAKPRNPGGQHDLHHPLS